ncbi:MAG: hypothetical protein WAU02_02375 [Candidatus Saccharimonadales bacterium]
MVLLTLKHAITYSFYGMTAFAASFFASLFGRFEYQHPAWISLHSLGLYVAVIILTAILVAMVRAHLANDQSTYRAA